MVSKRLILSGALDDRFAKLIRERLPPGAEKARLDERIRDLFGEQWCIMSTDLSGFSRGVARLERWLPGWKESASSRSRRSHPVPGQPMKSCLSLNEIFF